MHMEALVSLFEAAAACYFSGKTQPGLFAPVQVVMQGLYIK